MHGGGCGCCGCTVTLCFDGCGYYAATWRFSDDQKRFDSDCVGDDQQQRLRNTFAPFSGALYRCDCRSCVRDKNIF